MPPGPLYPFDHRRAIRVLSRADERLARLIARAGPFRMKLQPSRSPYESLLEAILHQQITGKAAATILARVKESFGMGDFPEPQEILRATRPALRAAGLSRQKAAALRDLAAKSLDGTVPGGAAIAKMKDEEIVAGLTTVRGVGVWTVEMFLMFSLGRPDVLPVEDYGIRKGFALTYRCRDLPKPKRIAAYGERWRPYRSVASWYLWRAVELHRKKKATGP